MPFQQTIIQGNVGRDVEMRYTSEGKAIANFSIAVGEKVKGEDRTEWFNCVAFDRTAEVAGDYLKKGSAAMVTGRLRTEEWEDKQTGEKRKAMKLMVDRLVLLGGKRDAEERPEPAARPAPAPAPKAGGVADMDDDIPF